MHVPINLKSPNNISEWQKEFNSAFKGLMYHRCVTSDGFIHYKPICSVQQTEKSSESSRDILPSWIYVGGSVLLLNEASHLHSGTQRGYFKGDFSLFFSFPQDTCQGINP